MKKYRWFVNGMYVIECTISEIKTFLNIAKIVTNEQWFIECSELGLKFSLEVKTCRVIKEELKGSQNVN